MTFALMRKFVALQVLFWEAQDELSIDPCLAGCVELWDQKRCCFNDSAPEPFNHS